jgi:hypothetical protein
MGRISTKMKQSARDTAHTTLKIRLPQRLQQQLAADAAGKSLSRFIVERLHADSFAPVEAGLSPEIDVRVYDAALRTLLQYDRLLALHYSEVHTVADVLLKVADILAPTSALLRRPQSGSIEERQLQDARDEMHAAIAITNNLPEIAAETTATVPEADPEATPSRDRISSFSAPLRIVLRHQRPTSARRPGQAEDMAGNDDRLDRLPDAGNSEQQPPSSLVQVKIRLPEILRRQLKADATRNNRTLTAEIRARLELTCALGIYTRHLIRWFDETLGAAAAKAFEVHRQRHALSADGLYAVVGALRAADAILNPIGGFVRRGGPESAAGLELQDARLWIRLALGILERWREATTEPARRPRGNVRAVRSGQTIKLRSGRS